MEDDAALPSLRPETLTVIEGQAREDRAAPCPACLKPVQMGQAIATSLGDARVGALGVTVHAECYAAVGRPGLLELMVAAYERSRGGRKLT